MEERLKDAFAFLDCQKRIEATSNHPPVLFHIGLHKTGSTWLQRQFFPSIQGAVFKDDFGPTHRSFINPGFGKFSLYMVETQLSDLMATSRIRGVPLILSDEALGGRPFGQRFYSQIFAFRLKAAFPDARILIVCREQRAILGSFYGEYLRYGHSRSLLQFIQSGGPDSKSEEGSVRDYYRYDQMLDFYRGVFGEKNVVMVPMEWMLRNPEGMLERLSELLGSELCFVRSPNMQTERPAWSSWAQGIQRLANQHLLRDGRMHRELGILKPNALAYRVDRLTPAWARRRGSQKRRQLIEMAVGDRFVASNRRLAESIGFDLGAFGYSV